MEATGTYVPAFATAVVPVRASSGGALTAAMLVVLVVLALAAGYYVYRRRKYHQKLTCGSYSGGSALVCAKLGTLCRGAPSGACSNAAAKCMPLVDAALKAPAGAPDGILRAIAPHVAACAEAVAAIPPADAAKLAQSVSGGKACVPPGMAGALGSAADRAALATAMTGFAPVAGWGVNVAARLPACPGA